MLGKLTGPVALALVLLLASIEIAGASNRPQDRDSDRVEWLWLRYSLGYKHLGLRTFSAGDDELTAGILSENLHGPAHTLAAGTKLWFLTLGATASAATLSAREQTGGSHGDLQLWGLGAEVSFRAPLGAAEPFLLLGGGYSTFGSSGDLIRGLQRGLNIDGINLSSGVGVDYYMSPLVSVRLRGTVDVLFLSREGVPVRELAMPQRVGTLNEAEARILEADGSSAGLAVEIAAGAALHF
jgi:hypothetical protein